MYAGHAAAASAAGADGIVFYPSSAAMAARGDAGVSPAGGGRWLPQPECFDEEDCGLDPGDVAATVVPGDFADAVLRALGEVARAVNSSRPMSRPMTLKGVWFQIVEMMMNLKRTQTLPFKCNKCATTSGRSADENENKKVILGGGGGGGGAGICRHEQLRDCVVSPRRRPSVGLRAGPPRWGEAS